MAVLLLHVCTTSGHERTVAYILLRSGFWLSKARKRCKSPVEGIRWWLGFSTLQEPVYLDEDY